LVIHRKSALRRRGRHLERLELIARSVAWPRRRSPRARLAGPGEPRPVANHVARKLPLAGAEPWEPQRWEIEEVLQLRGVVGAGREADGVGEWKRRREDV